VVIFNAIVPEEMGSINKHWGKKSFVVLELANNSWKMWYSALFQHPLDDMKTDWNTRMPYSKVGLSVQSFDDIIILRKMRIWLTVQRLK